MNIDHPYVRRSLECPLCGCNKPFGLVACWPCYNEHDMRNGNPSAEHMIDGCETLIRSLVTEGSLR
jgi:hypothetical protein